MATKKNDSIKISNALGDLGIVYRFSGDLYKSSKLLEQQLEQTREIHFKAGEGKALWELSQTQFLQGKYELAISNAEKAREIKIKLSDPVSDEISEELSKWKNYIELTTASS